MENQQKPDNFLVWAILSTCLCCLPAGIVAIVYANKVDPAWSAGNYQEAETAAKNARMWTIISAGVGVAVMVVGLLFGCMAAVLG